MSDTALRWRQAFFGGIIGIFFACLGWFFWGAFWGKFLELLMGGLIGMGLGVVIEGSLHYLRMARAEAAQGLDTPAIVQEAQARTTREQSLAFTSGARIVTLTLLGVGLFGAEIAEEILKAMYVPILVSVLTLAPVGILFTWTFGEVKSLTTRRGPVWGALVGALTAVMMGGIYLLLGVASSSHASSGSIFAGLLGWWMLVGIGYGISSGDRLFANPFAPLGGMLLAFSIVFTLSIPRVATLLETVPFTKEVASLVEKMLASPDLPLVVWEEAEKRSSNISTEHSSPPTPIPQVASQAEQPARAQKLSLVESWLGCKLEPFPALSSASMSPEEWKLALTALTKPYPDQTAAEAHAIALYGQQLKSLREGGVGANDAAADGDVIARRLRELSDRSRLRRQEKLCMELHRGTASGLLRSWLVLSLFSFGLGVAPFVENALRPRNYLASRTYKTEGTLIILLIVLWRVGVRVFRLKLI